ncbi:MAG: nucleotidyl transferase AbiEii/AbiGii toxin family protein [Proteiniphilum sp.]|jgi:predicted nucleotidyltransferase component of viral defense system|nr:nucleotidyl transferase AbiEii/AbiGii toxin family protein [Proteiniphilum sp.]
MLDINKHKLYLFQILKDIYEDKELSGILGFKGGTALMFFYDLPRFSVDLDFNLLNPDKEKQVYNKITGILSEHKLKIEISKRDFDDSYEIKNLLGVSIKVMVKPDMFAHKLCALMDRKAITNRDVFDCWFFMNSKTPLNKSIVEQRMGMPLPDYLQKCIDMLQTMSDKGLLNGLGELMDDEMKNFVRHKLRTESITLMKFYKQFPVI